MHVWGEVHVWGGGACMSGVCMFEGGGCMFECVCACLKEVYAYCEGGEGEVIFKNMYHL